jgi:single-strand DNA-binding protein
VSSYNRVILVGNLTRDPELKYLPSNMAVCEIGLAVNHRWRDREGNQREDVCFVDVSIFGRAGETVNQYMSKGRPILIEGRLKYDTWTAQDGTKRSKHSVVADNFTFLGSREGAAGGGTPRTQEGGGPAPRPSGRAAQVEPAYGGPVANEEPPAEQIPF